MEPEDAQKSCQISNIDADTMQISSEDAFDEDSVSIAAENLIQKLMHENRSLKKELILLKEMNGNQNLMNIQRCSRTRCFGAGVNSDSKCNAKEKKNVNKVKSFNSVCYSNKSRLL